MKITTFMVKITMMVVVMNDDDDEDNPHWL